MLVPDGMDLPDLALRFIPDASGREHDDSRHAPSGSRGPQSGRKATESNRHPRLRETP